jgi:hypothetical protein
MKRLAVLALFLLVFHYTPAYCAPEQAIEAPAKTEKELIARIVKSLRDEDSAAHSSQFMQFDDLWKLVINFRDTNVVAGMQVAQLRQAPNTIRKFDPFFNPQIGLDFNHVIEKGEDSAVHWDKIELARYELKKIGMTEEMVGYNYIAPLRFQGYIFVRDNFTRKIFAIAVTDIQNIKGNWYGGHVVDIFEADTEDKYLAKLKREEAWYKKLLAEGIDIDSMKRSIDSIKNADSEHGADSGVVLTRKEVVERKYYFGLLDDEIPVTLYVQYLRGGCKEKVCEWIAIFKFDEEGEYIKTSVHKENGKWYFTQEPDKSVLELEIKGKAFEGTFLSIKDQIEYEAYFEEIVPKQSTKEKLDALVDELWYDNQY